MVWLEAIPEGSTTKRSETYKYQLPDIEGGKDLIGHLRCLGWCVNTGMGKAPISYTEMANWMALTGTNLTPWEVEIIHEMSETFAQIAATAQDKDSKPPFELEANEDRHKRNLAALFG